MKIALVVPVVWEGPLPLSVESFVRAAREGSEIEVFSLDRGPASIESEYEEVLAAPETVAKVVEAEAKGAEAVVIDCMLDPGLDAAREKVSIPVVGPAKASTHVAAMLGHRFSIVTVVERLVAPFYKRVRAYGLAEKLASVRAIEVPVLELHQNREAAVPLLVEQAVKAIDGDGAHVIVFGCTGMAGLAQEVRLGLEGRGYPVPVVDPSITALRVAEALVDLGLSQSKRTYPAPPQKTIVGYPAF